MLLQTPEKQNFPLRLRAQVWTQRARLDAALADGADVHEDAAIGLRARQLTRPASVRAIARALCKVVDAAEAPHEPWRHDGSRPPLQREAVLAARDHLLEIAELLRNAVYVDPQAAALASLLVWDSASPLYAGDAGASVEQWAETVLSEL